MRIYAVSDLHADRPDNRRLLDTLPEHEHRGDALIVAGDVADSLEVMAETLGLLRERFAEVFFVPGNHELWVRGREMDSVQKFHAVLDRCDSLGVHTRPARAGEAWVVPLLSWYHESFDVRGDGVAEELEAWADRYFCRWPEGLGRIDRFFLGLNTPHVHAYDAPVVSYSHFVPRLDLVPPVRWLHFKGLPLVAGSAGIEEQVRRVGSKVHVFGHTHIPEDRTILGVRYVQHWLRPPSENGSIIKPVWTSGAPLFC
jgi:predicted phosphodiesterase